MTRIDAHTHLFSPAQIAAREENAGRDPVFAEMYANPKAKMAHAEDLRAALVRAEIGGAVVAGFAFSSEREIAEQNEYVLGQVASSSPEMFIPLATLNLRHGGWHRVAERALIAGARGFGELRPHSQGWDPLGPESLRLGEMAAESGAVLLWHVSEPVGHLYPGKEGGITPTELCKLAERLPSTKMIAAHLGGGLTYYLQMPEVRTQLSSVYFDTAAWPLLYDDLSIPRLIDLAGPGRVLFASDYPLLSPRRQLERIIPLLPAGTVEDICGRNVETLFAKAMDR